MSLGSGGVVGSGGEGGGPDFNLPDEILAVIPIDPYDQLDLARKITSMAIASRVSKLEVETNHMRQKLNEKDSAIFELQEQLANAQRACQEAESRLSITLDENAKLSKERESLAFTAKKLGRDLAKLETFKRQLMQSLNDDNSSQTETVDIGTCDQTVHRAYPDRDTSKVTINPHGLPHERANGFEAHNSFHDPADSGNSVDDAHGGKIFSITPYITPRLTPTGTPKLISTSVSPRGYSAAATPQRTSGTTSPSKFQYDGRPVLSSWYPPRQQSSAANSPPRGRSLPARPPRIDGKEFFRQARSRLSYEQFSAFLANVKELNAHKQTREETLKKAEEIFGTDNKDLYLSFHGLLNRNV